MKKPETHEEFLQQNPHLKEFYPMLGQLNKESHRGAVVLSCSFIEDQLRNILASFLIETKETEKLLEGFNAPLGTLSSRAVMAHSLGLITDREYKEIEILKKIRNEFAHNFKATFNDQKIIDLCKTLKFSAKDYGDVVVDAFGQYNTAAVSLIINLTNRAHYVSKSRLTKREWPY